jgi:UDP-glucose:(heptosyl)LPS alpha-1,3-glucosyltransferase
LHRTQELRPSVRSELGYKAADHVVVFAANEFERKGFEPLLRAIALLSDRRVHLLAVGRLNPATYERRISHLGLSDRVRFTGPTNEVARYYAAADVFALPTQYEAWGLVVIEAMACGLPVLTSRLAGAAIAVQEGHGGYLLDDPRSSEEISLKLRRLLDARHASHQCIAESVAAYAWPRVLLDYERVLMECASSGAAA